MALRAKDDDTLLHEPRALWAVIRQQAAESAATIYNTRQTDETNFKNGSRYPITLTKMLVSGIGYTYRQYVDVAAASSVHNSMVAANLVQIAVAAPYSVHWGHRDFIATNLPPLPVSQPNFYVASPPSVAQDYRSSIWGLSRWQFDRLLWLPRGCTIQLDLGACYQPNLAWTADNSARYLTQVSLDEHHTGMLGGNNRVRPYQQMPWAQGTNLAAMGAIQADAFGAEAAPLFNGVVNNTPQMWDADGMFQGRLFNQQESNRGQDKDAFTAFNVMIDQIEYDEQIQALGAPASLDPIAPLSTRVTARARCINGGSGEWWWRPGAPVCLVTPSIGDALVYELPEPIVLGPGEHLEVEVQIPAGVSIDAGSGPVAYRPTYQIGISFTGYASIELGS